MGRHMHAIGQKRHGMEKKARSDLHQHEQRGDQRRQPGARFRPLMALPQEDMAASPDAVAVRVGVTCMRVIVCHHSSVAAGAGQWNHFPVTIS